MTHLPGARWTELDDTARRVLVIPVGSLEQHGPHLPLDTDTRIAAEVVRRACADAPGAWAAPAIAIGASGEHAGFPGTLSIGTAALTQTLIELGRHASATWPRLIFANAHGGNAEALRAAHDVLTGEDRRAAVWHARLPGGDAHAGRTETSLMLAIDPASVALDQAAPGDTRPLAELMPLLRGRGVRGVSPNGVLGDPAGATADEGERLLRTLTDSLKAVLASDRTDRPSCAACSNPRRRPPRSPGSAAPRPPPSAAPSCPWTPVSPPDAGRAPPDHGPRTA